MKATLTRFALAAMIAAGVTDVLADGITVSEDTASTYVPTTIVNGSFDEEPWMVFSMTNGTETYTYTRENRDWHLYSSSGTIKACYPNGVNGGWNTTENQPYQGTLFEYTCNLSGYNSNIHSPDAANYFVEMNANNSAVLYQDLGTCGNDVIRWSLKHAVRTSAGVNVQSMRVEIGAPEYSGGDIVAAQGVNENVDSHIQSSTKAVYRASGITNPAGNAYGFNGSNLDKLSLDKTDSADNAAWHTVTGVYVVPAGQSVTRFGFIAEMKMDENPSCGNLLDDITFSTLIGNLSARQLESYDVELKGYWGETDASKSLKVVVGSTTYDVDMTSVAGKNFKIVIPAATIGSATSVHVYHQDYEDAGRTISLMSALESWNRDYTGDIQTFTAPSSGIYQLRVWGAQGGSREGNGGLGGYATCRTTLTKDETIYVYVGGRGGDATGNGGAGGWNGGGKGGTGYDNLNGSAGGGGATHISKVNNQIIGNGCTFLGGTDYIVVAGGGGGRGFWNATPGNGGGTEGGLGSRHSGSNYSDDFYFSTTQSVGANGGNGNAGGWNGEGAGGGGGGYYGGTANHPYSTFPDEGYDNNASGCGGNSACNSAFATAFSTTAGQREGDGMAEINLLIRGKGTADDPCLIGNEQELKNFAAIVNSGSANLHGKLTAPIDLEGSQANQWTPIGTSSHPYNGTFDGQGFTISNLYFVQKEGNVGLFGCAGASARIKNIRVVGYIDNSGNGATAAGGSTTAGGILGRGESGTVIINCSVAGSVLSFSNVGGIAGSGAVTIVNCYNEATVKFYSAMGQVGGGIYGWGGIANTPTLVNCYNVGKIVNTGDATSHMGNITAAATATDCYSLANCCQNGAGAGWSNGAANQVSGMTMTSEAMHSTSFVSTLNGNAAAQRSTYSDIEDWMLHPTTSLPVHSNSFYAAIWGEHWAWAEDNGITGAWDATDESGVPNAFRYVFDQPAGELEAVSGVDVVGSSVVMTTNAVVNAEGFTIGYALDKVSVAGEVIEEGTPSASAEDLAIDYGSVVSNAYFKVAVVVESTGWPESRTKMESEATIGVIAITNAPATAIIGVPWVALAGGGEISVSNLVHTANLTAGDELKAFDADGKLHSWTLTDGAWVPDYVSGGTGTEMSEDADKIKLARGKGVWLTRQHPEEQIYLVGQVAEGNASTPLEKPKETGSQTWNLVASPKVEPVDVAQLLAGRQATDKVMVPTAGAPKNFIYSASAGKWGYIDYQTDENGFVRAYFVTDDTTVPAGTGFWYLNGNSEHDSLDWEE